MKKTCESCLRSFKGRKERKFCSRACQRLSASWKQNIGNANKGKLLGRESFKKIMSNATRGEKNPRWLKDRSKLKTRRGGFEKFQLEEWRKAVFERDDFTCQICKVRGGRLNADHIRPVFLFPELTIDVSNGRTLCVACHKETPTYGTRVLSLTREDFKE